MREFLSKFQNSYRNLEPDISFFLETVELINNEIGRNAFRVTSSVNKSVCDAIMVSIAQLLKEKVELKNIKINHQKLVKDEEFIRYVTSGTSTETHVRNRIIIAKNYFLGLK
jgi:hypothetical protein